MLLPEKIIKSFDQNDPMVAFLNKYKQQVKHKDKSSRADRDNLKH